MEAIHHCLMQYAKKAGIETGRKIRIDSTAIDSDVHDPTDASLLWDGVRIITRWLEQGHTLTPRPDYRYSDHLRVVKKRHLAVVNAKKEDARVAAYRDMTLYAGKVVRYAKEAIPALQGYDASNHDDMLAAINLKAQVKSAVCAL